VRFGSVSRRPTRTHRATTLPQLIPMCQPSSGDQRKRYPQSGHFKVLAGELLSLRPPFFVLVRKRGQ
jgi:hypothetical protein